MFLFALSRSLFCSVKTGSWVAARGVCYGRQYSNVIKLKSNLAFNERTLLTLFNKQKPCPVDSKRVANSYDIDPVSRVLGTILLERGSHESHE